MTDFVALIPARLASTRLPDKPLADLAGQPMVVRVAGQARASGARRVVVATDAPAIAEARRRASGPLSYAFLPRDRARFTIARSAAPISRMTTSAIT